jgi:hypothetical protein
MSMRAWKDEIFWAFAGVGDLREALAVERRRKGGCRRGDSRVAFVLLPSTAARRSPGIALGHGAFARGLDSAAPSTASRFTGPRAPGRRWRAGKS